MKALFTLTIIFLCLPGYTAAQTKTELNPGGRNKPGFVYDSARQKFVLFGGFGNRGEGVKGDTWEWDGKQWTQVATIGPSARGALGMAYDSKRKKVVLFGGVGTNEQFDDTWEWDGKSWKQVAKSGPSARAGMQMVYDSRRDRIVGFGGFDQTKLQLLGETWEWDGKAWQQMSSAGPAPRANFFMANDSRKGKVVVVGGNQTANPPSAAGLLGDTWEWDGKQWMKVAETELIKRDHHGMSYDSARGRLVVFGGWNGKFLGDTWEWDGTKWIAIQAVGPSARGGIPSLAYDTDRKKVMLFGGWDETGPRSDLWEWDGRRWSQVK